MGARSLAASPGRWHLQHSGSEGIGKGFEPAGLVVEVAEIVVHEGDQPDFLAHLLDAHLLPGEYGAEVDLLPIEADAPACGHGDRFVVEWVFELGQAGVAPGRRTVAL